MRSRMSSAHARPARTRGAIRTLGIAAIPLLLLTTAGGALLLRPAPHAAHAAALSGLRVRGNQLQDTTGKSLRLLGVNRSGTEYACIQGWGIFDGPSDAASVQAMAAWHVNSVRVPLNEDCWLGINGAPAASSGSTYRQAIVSYVNLLHQYGMYAELTLMWSAPGTQQATFSNQAPDSDHAPAFWTSVAQTFAGDPLTFFGLFNEPHGVSSACWQQGGSACNGQVGFSVASAQTLINTIRATGATNVIADQCVQWSNDCSQWLANEPSDPDGQLIAEAHVYGKNACDTAACLDQTMAPVARTVPLIFGELGETYDGSDCNGSTSYTSTFMNWADAHNVSYQAWTWDTWGSCHLALISSYTGAPDGAYGSYVQQHLLAESSGGGGGGGSTPTPTATTTATTSPTATATTSPTSSPSPSPSPTSSPTPGDPCVTPTIAFGAQSASASQVAVDQPITFTTSFTASCATTGLVDIEVFTASGHKIWQTWEDQEPLTGQSQTFSGTWNVPASQAPGGYYASIGVFSPGWTRLWGWRHQAAIFSVTGGASSTCTSGGGPAIHFIGAAATPNPAESGSIVHLSVTFQTSCAIRGLVDYAVYDSDGDLVYQTWLSNRWLSGQRQTFTVSWSVPSGRAPGTYSLSLGVFSPDWSTLYGWDQAAAPLTIQQ